MSFLPNYERALIAIEKLKDYCLNPFHPVGKDKAIVFRLALGLTDQDADYLKLLRNYQRAKLSQEKKINTVKGTQ